MKLANYSHLCFHDVCGFLNLLTFNINLFYFIVKFSGYCDNCCHVEYLIISFYIQMYNEAGVLFEKCELWEKAAGVYVKSKNWLAQ